jgi:hypothetical protein
LVHATFESGTEMLIAGRPVTLGDAVAVGVVAHAASTNPATKQTATIRTSERTWAGT